MQSSAQNVFIFNWFCAASSGHACAQHGSIINTRIHEQKLLKNDNFQQNLKIRALHLPLQKMIFNKNKIECFLLYLFFSCLLYQKAAPAPCCKKSLDKFLKILTKQQLILLQILSNLRPGNTTLLAGSQKPTP